MHLGPIELAFYEANQTVNEYLGPCWLARCLYAIETRGATILRSTILQCTLSMFVYQVNEALLGRCHTAP